MDKFLTFTILGLSTAAIYAVAASGLVVTYTTSGIFNFAHGAVAMMAAFVYWQLTSPAATSLPIGIALALALVVVTPGAMVVQAFVQWFRARHDPSRWIV